MSPSPINEQDEEGVIRYGAAWQAIMQLVRKGSSWSGYERNCAFLNTGGKFVASSHVSGLDFVDDGRGVAVSDWDQDGDLDLWFRNRTAPRIRLMLNSSSSGRPGRFVAFRLEGTRANRDAIGAVVELEVSGYDKRLIRSVRAGDMFLSQSSKWVHFGLPENASPKRVKVLWPGGERSVFEQVKAGRRYHLKQGERSAIPIVVDRVVSLKAEALPAVAASSGRASVVLPAPVRLPFSSYYDGKGRRTKLSDSISGRLLVLWSASCPHCRTELSELADSPVELPVLALCVDGRSEEARSAAQALILETGFTGAWGMVGEEEIEQVFLLQEALFDSVPHFAVPLSLLLNKENEVIALYRGALNKEVLEYDRREVLQAARTQLRDLAPPFPGRWFTEPAAAGYASNLVARRTQERYPEFSVFYLRAAAESSRGDKRRALMAELGRRHYLLAMEFDRRQLSERSAFHFSSSLEVAPTNPSVHNDFGSSLARRGLFKEGAHHFMEALRLKPDFPLAKENLAKAQRLLEQSK